MFFFLSYKTFVGLLSISYKFVYGPLFWLSTITLKIHYWFSINYEMGYNCGFFPWLLSYLLLELYHICESSKCSCCLFSVGHIIINRTDNSWGCSLWKQWSWCQSPMAIWGIEISSPCFPKNSGSGTIWSSVNKGWVVS